MSARSLLFRALVNCLEAIRYGPDFMHYNLLTFFRVSVSVSVPVDLELTGLSVPSTLSSRRIFNGDGGTAMFLDSFKSVDIMLRLGLSSKLLLVLGLEKRQKKLIANCKQKMWFAAVQKQQGD